MQLAKIITFKQQDYEKKYYTHWTDNRIKSFSL
jgi:hypothetical protein